MSIKGQGQGIPAHIPHSSMFQVSGFIIHLSFTTISINNTENSSQTLNRTAHLFRSHRVATREKKGQAPELKSILGIWSAGLGFPDFAVRRHPDKVLAIVTRTFRYEFGEAIGTLQSRTLGYLLNCISCFAGLRRDVYCREHGRSRHPDEVTVEGLGLAFWVLGFRFRVEGLGV